MSGTRRVPGDVLVHPRRARDHLDRHFAEPFELIAGLAERTGDDLLLGPDFRWCTVFNPQQPEVHIHLTTPSGPLPDYTPEDFEGVDMG